MYNKLVRDKIPEIIESNGEIPVVRTLDNLEYKIELERKLEEEVKEALNESGENRIEEFADILEVMISLARLENKTLDDIINACDKKRKKRGGFDKKIYLSEVK